MRSPRVSLKVKRITKFKLQNRICKQFWLREKCSFVQFGHMWHFERLGGLIWRERHMFNMTGRWFANCVPREPFHIDHFIGVLAWMLKPLGERFQSGLVVRFGKKFTCFQSHIDLTYVSTFVGSHGAVRWVPRRVSSTENVQGWFCMISICNPPLTSASTHIKKQ